MKPSRLVGLYPEHWRERYGTEFSALLEELPASPSVVLDVAVAAIGTRLSYLRRGFTGTDGNALLVFIVMGPSIIVVLAFALKFKVGIAGPFDAISGPAQGIAILHYYLVFAPWLSLALASRALVRPSVRRSGTGLLSIQLETRADPMTLAIALVALLLLFVLMRYFFFQHSPVWGSLPTWPAPWPWFPPPWDRR
jgi:hypothetical protein